MHPTHAYTHQTRHETVHAPRQGTPYRTRGPNPAHAPFQHSQLDSIPPADVGAEEALQLQALQLKRRGVALAKLVQVHVSLDHLVRLAVGRRIDPVSLSLPSFSCPLPLSPLADSRLPALRRDTATSGYMQP